jgi:hypothetical protein
MKYEIWQSDEAGFDDHIKTFTDWDRANDYMRHCEKYRPGYHFRLIIVKE